MDARYRELRERLSEVTDLSATRLLLSWDQQTMMPPQGGPVRAEQLATLDRLIHERFTSPHIGRLLEELRDCEERLPYESDEASLVRVARRRYEKEVRVPGELRAEIGRAESLALPAWIDARARSDFASFVPHLRRNLELVQRYVDCFDDADEPYDVLLDEYEPQMKTADVRLVFERLKEGLIPLIAQAADSDQDDTPVHQAFPVERQRAFATAVIERFGFRAEAWRLDESAHPFASSSSTNDIRLTTRYDEHYLNSALFGAMHECGHGLYENGSGPALERTPLAGGASMALHESQSRLWENLVGRSRPFWRHFYAPLQATFPEQLERVDEERFYRAVNVVRPSLIRVEADEATYSLHIILRFELEQEMLAGSLSLDDLPEAWNERMNEYLGVEVRNDAEGVLQDIHWAAGSLGYFPTYALGNVVSVQIWDEARSAIAELDAQFERGEFGPLREWLRENLYRHGRKFTTGETLERLTGGPIDAGPYLRYLQAKLGELHGVPA